jgi:hypothetical protein
MAHQSRTIETSLTPKPTEGTSIARECVCTTTNMPAVPAIIARDIMGQELRVIKLRASNFGGVRVPPIWEGSALPPQDSGESWVAQSVRRRITDTTVGGLSWFAQLRQTRLEILYVEPKGNDHTDTVATSLCPSSVVKADLE